MHLCPINNSYLISSPGGKLQSRARVCESYEKIRMIPYTQISALCHSHCTVGSYFGGAIHMLWGWYQPSPCISRGHHNPYLNPFFLHLRVTFPISDKKKKGYVTTSGNIPREKKKKYKNAGPYNHTPIHGPAPLSVPSSAGLLLAELLGKSLSGTGD